MARLARIIGAGVQDQGKTPSVSLAKLRQFTEMVAVQMFLGLGLCMALLFMSCKCGDETQQQERSRSKGNGTIVNASHAGQVRQAHAQLRTRFTRLLRRWEKHMDEVSFSSRSQDYLDCQAYRDIVALGQPALPLIVDAMRRGGDIWLFLAVRDITGVTPADLEEGLDDEGDDRGWNLEHVRGLYIQWWDTEGFREFGEKRSQPRNDNQGERPL